MASATTVPAGSLRERVRFEVRATVPDGLGGSSATWTPVLTGVSAQIAPTTRASEIVLSQGVQPVGTYMIWVRGCAAVAAITPAHRVVNERTGVAYNIRDIENPDQRGRFYLIMAQAGTAVS